MEETIELRKLLEIVWEGKVIIAIWTIVCMLLAGIASWYVLDEKYESKAIVQVASAVQDTGIMSNYVATEFTPAIYAQRIQNKPIMQQALQAEGIKVNYNEKNLVATVDADPTKNLVELKFTSRTSKEAQQQLQILMEATKQKMNESVQMTLQDLENTYKIEADALTKEIDIIIEQYNQIIRENNLPKILILQTILNTEMVINISEEQAASLSNVNGNLQNKLLQLQSQIQTKSEEYRKTLSNYQSVKTGLDSFKPDPFIRVIAEPTLPEEASSPNKLLNLIIGLVIGAILGMGAIFFRHYWRNSTVVK
ncbi:Wzz/FepE/Etk N-terminal domain-containing protein [Lysinibacillus fusiformis]|uniref:Wzz/FepE/Etk N-terminal domain-containing protein n=1 Tax=Lysinibacillus fusiformis TaxID=28031 RepID=UPI00263B0DBE|nr:Wzz/FepE/Etk N-terminal domain-containing protein [Lysinibacillus fusiformis]MDC6270273.1 Wzz/FepE/Etk N-terminal domain-containing protein [Lysinibacillus sphaericus]MDN4971674.1 Wzz/FepE/Etk N-terminal domain-containing protein [Lysinibacillus fusiformis]